MRFPKSYLISYVVFCQLSYSSAFFFPLFSNFFNKFRNNNRHFGENGGSNPFAGNGGNSTQIRVPIMSRSVLPERRVDIITTVISNGTVQQNQVKISNVSTTAAAEAVLSQKLIVPTSTSVTGSMSLIQQKNSFGQPSTLTLPFTPNLFGMMSYVQALKDIKRNYKTNEHERKIEFLNKEAGDNDLMTRILRTLIQKVVNKYQKSTEILKLKILKRQERLQHFLQMPMVAGVIASDQAEVISRGHSGLGKDGRLIGDTPSGKQKPSIIDSFLI